MLHAPLTSSVSLPNNSELRLEGVDWADVAQNVNEWRAPVNTASQRIP
jgi:hypothetical protein